MNPLLITFLLCLLPCFPAKDTINFDESVADGEVIVSGGENFSLGFFSPGVSSSNRYLGIWYTKVSVQTIVWVANRDNPINDTSGVLSFDSHGHNLVLRCCPGKNTTAMTANTTPLWSTNISASSSLVLGNKSMARLSDLGNLVVLLHQEPTKNSDENDLVWWESFDHPTDTVLPFMRFGLDRNTGMNNVVVPWKSPADPAAGDSSYYLDPNGSPELMLYRGRTKWWRGGMWNGIRWSGIPNMSYRFIFNSTYVSNEASRPSSMESSDLTIVSRIYVDSSGYLRRATWNDRRGRWNEFWYVPKEPCDYYGRCGPNGNCDPYRGAGEFECSCIPGFEPKITTDWSMNDGSGGCARKKRSETASSCGNGKEFVTLKNAKVPDTTIRGQLQVGMDLNMCRQECLGNCSCTAYTSSNLSSGIGCVMWHGDLLDTRMFANGGQDFDIITATANFSSDNKLGQGGFGSVYKVWDLWKEGRALEMMDSSSMALESHFDQVMRCIHIGLLCVQESPADRPTMLNVVFMLGNATSALSSAKKPAFILKMNSIDSNSSVTAVRPEIPSMNNMSMSDLEAR
ncbi:unnamed protein product [Linum tenue]|uniref:non-specific serine/threonine protein kinase n=1 Tax=Linum tenue TaxID=586396 RepID=A0AAV0JDR3_9ROSI|nr:unnamed protein product [Linum tenue]